MNLSLCHGAKSHFKFRGIKCFQDVNFSKDTFPGENSVMFFPQAVLPTEARVFCFTVWEWPDPHQRAYLQCDEDHRGSLCHREHLRQLRARLPVSFNKTGAIFGLKAPLGLHEGRDRVFHANSRAPGAPWAPGYYFEGWRGGGVEGSFEDFFFPRSILQSLLFSYCFTGRFCRWVKTVTENNHSLL